MSSDLSGARVTITLGDYDGVMLNEDVWTSDGEKLLSVEMVRGATCLQKKDLLVEVADPDLYESSARRPKGLPAPAEPTLTERVWVKSKRNHSRTLKTKQPVIQLEYAFLDDTNDDPQVTLLTAIDLLSGLCIVPNNGRSVYAHAVEVHFGNSPRFWHTSD